MQLTYRAYDKTGQAVAETIEAPSHGEALERLRRQGLFVASLSAAPGDAPRGASPATGVPAPRRRMGRTRRLKHLAMFSRQMSVLLRSGLTVAEALHAVQRQADNAAWRDRVADIRQRVTQGTALSDALAEHEDCFDGVYRGTVKAGEATGDLAVMLDRLAQLTIKHVQARTAALGAMVYPAMLLVVASAVFSVVTLVMVPRFGELFAALDVPLPGTTAAMLRFSTFLRTDGWMVGIGLAGLVAGLVVAVRTPRGQYVMDGVVLALPQSGKLTKGFTTARILRLLGTLMDSRVPALDALGLVRGAMRNSRYQALLDRTCTGVSRGQPIAAGLSDTGLISPAAVEALRSAELSGQMGPMLTSFADFMDEENAVRLKVLTGIMEPAILLLLGLVVGVLAVSMFLPLFDLTAMTGGGP